MRHRKAYRKFGLPSDQRRALLKSLTRNLVLNDRIVTTETRAKAVRPIVEKLITLAQTGGPQASVAAQLHARRMARRYVDSNVREFVRATDGTEGKPKVARNSAYVIPRLFDVVAPRYVDRHGGYTRMTKVQFRRGDGAPVVLLEFVEGGPADVKEAAPVDGAQERKRRLLGLRRARK